MCIIFWVCFRCEDLETYAEEVGVQASLILLNKSDLLTEQQRKVWAEYFDKQVTFESNKSLFILIKYYLIGLI